MKVLVSYFYLAAIAQLTRIECQTIDLDFLPEILNKRLTTINKDTGTCEHCNMYQNQQIGDNVQNIYSKKGKLLQERVRNLIRVGNV